MQARNVIEYFESLRPVGDSQEQCNRKHGGEGREFPVDGLSRSHGEFLRCVHAEIMRQYMHDPLRFREAPPADPASRFAGLDLKELAERLRVFAERSG